MQGYAQAVIATNLAAAGASSRRKLAGAQKKTPDGSHRAWCSFLMPLPEKPAARQKNQGLFTLNLRDL